MKMEICQFYLFHNKCIAETWETPPVFLEQAARSTESREEP